MSEFIIESGLKPDNQIVDSDCLITEIAKDRIKLNVAQIRQFDNNLLITAAIYGFDRIVSFMISLNRPSDQTIAYMLEMASINNHTSIFSLFDQKNYTIDWHAHFTTSCRHGSMNVVRYIQDRVGSSILDQNEEYIFVMEHIPSKRPEVSPVISPLGYALQFGQVELVNYLLEQGLEHGVQVTSDEPLVYLAVLSDKIRLVRLMLSLGADPRAFNNAAFIRAAKADRFDMMKLLAQYL